MLDQFLIAPLTDGLQTDVEPWLIPDKAFSRLKNAYVWRGRLRKRFGSTYITPSSAPTTGFEQLTSRLRINLGNTDGAGDIAGTVPGAIFRVGQMFSIGTDLFTVAVLGTPGVMLTNGTATTLTYDTTTGAYDIQGSALTTACFFYPADPVMGILNYEDGPINEEPTYAFDTQFAYRYTAAGWVRLGTALWTGSNSQFFWGENYRGNAADDTLLFVTNNSATDNIRYFDGTIWNVAPFTPDVDTTGTPVTIKGCRLILAFKNRLILFNTYESIGVGAGVNFPNRIRYSQDGSPIATGAWIEGRYTAGKGGFEDASTQEAIISARILRDRVIVFFERSTWELVYTGNKVRPFVFQRINSELGVESTFSTVLFDKVLLGVGNVGMHACNGANVERIDQKIPQAVFNFHNGNQGVDRVFGIRDYFAETVYWTIPSQLNNPTYPTRVLVYNYKTKSWAENDDSITCFGYLQNLSDQTWELDTGTWQDDTSNWLSPENQSEYRQVIAGNQQGYTFVVNINSTRNAPVLQITNATTAAGFVTLTVIDHNLQVGDYILVENVLGATGVDGIYEIVIQIANTSVTIREANFGGVYTGGGTVTRVSQIDIVTKQYNFYQKQGKNMLIPKVAFYVDRTSNGQIQVDFSTSSSNRSLSGDGFTSGALIGTNVLETSPYLSVPYESSQEKFWHAVYPQTEGESIQMRLYLNSAQMLDENIALSDFQLNAISIYARQVHRY